MTKPTQPRAVVIDGDQFFETSTGLMVNISEMTRVYCEVVAQIRPGMSEAQIDEIIAATNKRMSPN